MKISVFVDNSNDLCRLDTGARIRRASMDEIEKTEISLAKGQSGAWLIEEKEL